MKQRLGVASEKASLVTRSKICVVVLVATVSIETVFIACSVLGSDSSPRSVIANSTSNTTIRQVGVTSPIPADDEHDATDFLRHYEVDCETLSMTTSVVQWRDTDGQTQSPVTVTRIEGSTPGLTHRPGAPKKNVHLHKATCPCVPHSLGKWIPAVNINNNYYEYIIQGSTLAVFRYPEHPRFSDGIPDSPAQ